jgi:hypothetical protein
MSHVGQSQSPPHFYSYIPLLKRTNFPKFFIYSMCFFFVGTKINNSGEFSPNYGRFSRTLEILFALKQTQTVSIIKQKKRLHSIKKATNVLFKDINYIIDIISTEFEVACDQTQISSYFNRKAI